MLSDKIYLGPDCLLSHSRIIALQLTWPYWCNIGKNEININPVRSDQPESENSCGDGSEYGVLHSKWAQLPFGLVEWEAFSLQLWPDCMLKSLLDLLLLTMKAEGWLSSSF